MEIKILNSLLQSLRESKEKLIADKHMNSYDKKNIMEDIKEEMERLEALKMIAQ